MDINTALVGVIAVQFLVIALLAWRQGGMLPPEVVTMIFSLARREASNTPAEWDDRAIEELQELYNRLKGQGAGSNE